MNSGFPLWSTLALLAAGCHAPVGANVQTEQPAAESPPIGTDRAAAGMYELTGQRETASALELRPDGHFRYFISIGALDRQAEGRWSSDGRRVVLNSEPRPRPAEFSMLPAIRDGQAPLRIFVGTPAGRGIAGVDLRVGLADGRVLDGYTQEDGWTLPAGETPSVQWIELSLTPYGVPPRRFAVSGAAGNRFNFSFTPNDFGIVDFRDRMLNIAGRNLLMRDGDTTLTYSRAD